MHRKQFVHTSRTTTFFTVYCIKCNLIARHKELYSWPRQSLCHIWGLIHHEANFSYRLLCGSFITVKPSISWKTTDIESQCSSPTANKQNGLCVWGEQGCQFDRMALCGSTTACCVCVSLRQTAGMCQSGDEWSRGSRALWTSCTVGLTCTTGLTCLWANWNSCVRFVSRRRGCLALTRRTDAVAQQKANVSSGIQRVVLNGSLWKPAG